MIEELRLYSQCSRPKGEPLRFCSLGRERSEGIFLLKCVDGKGDGGCAGDVPDAPIEIFEPSTDWSGLCACEGELRGRVLFRRLRRRTLLFEYIGSLSNIHKAHGSYA